MNTRNSSNDNVRLAGRRIRRITPVISPKKLRNELRLTGATYQRLRDSRTELESVLDGQDGRLVIMAGPCSIHNTGEGLKYARKLKKLSDRVSDKILVVMRTYFEKPRTVVGWKGLIVQPIVNPEKGSMEDQPDNIVLGLRTARRFLIRVAKIGLGTVTEFLDPLVPQYLGDLFATGTIGARTTESQTHRLMASGLSCPVGFKNGTDGDTETALNALRAATQGHSFTGINGHGEVCVFETAGNPHGYIVHRGGKSSTNFDPASVDATIRMMSEKGVKPRILIDCSHGNSMKKHENQAAAFRSVVEQFAGGKPGLIGAMLESNLKPGRQDVVPGQKLMPGVSITDECIGFEETERLIMEAYKQL